MKRNRVLALLMALALSVAFSGVAVAEMVKGKVSKIEGKKITVTTDAGDKTFEVTGKVQAKAGDQVEADVVEGKAKSLAKTKTTGEEKARKGT
jgi:hypothetical protein